MDATKGPLESCVWNLKFDPTSKVWETPSDEDPVFAKKRIRGFVPQTKGDF